MPNIQTYVRDHRKQFKKQKRQKDEWVRISAEKGRSKFNSSDKDFKEPLQIPCEVFDVPSTSRTNHNTLSATSAFLDAGLITEGDRKRWLQKNKEGTRKSYKITWSLPNIQFTPDKENLLKLLLTIMSISLRKTVLIKVCRLLVVTEPM